MKLYNQGFSRVLHQRQTPSAYEIKLMNRLSDLERLVYGEVNYKSFNLMLHEEAATGRRRMSFIRRCTVASIAR